MGEDGTMSIRGTMRLFAVLAMALAPAVAAGVPADAVAQGYISSPPLANAIKTGVRDCRTGTTLAVPLITWGADIATIHANGAGLRTKSGSLFAKRGLSITLARQDNFKKQIEAYLRCDTPFLRATLGMGNLVNDLAGKDPRTRMVATYQLSWSAGGDAIVAKPGINQPKDLKGKTIAVQAYGPHVDYLFTILDDAGLKPSDVKIKWTENLVGFTGSTPGAALRTDASVDAAMVIIPDAIALTSGGKTGTGSENSVKGAQIMLSTKTASRVITDLYYVRADYLEANRETVRNFVHALLKAEEETRDILKTKGARANALYRAAAKILLDSERAVADARALWADAEMAGYRGNVNFFANDSYPRRFAVLNRAVQSTYISLGLLKGASPMQHARWDYKALAQGLRDTKGVDPKRFRKDKARDSVRRKRAKGELKQATLFEFEVNFKPNQTSFQADLYQKAFERVVKLSSTYAGAVITIEGHADPLGYLRAKKRGSSQVVLNRIIQSARNLSVSRAQAVRDSVIAYGKAKGTSLDVSQFVVVGLGFSEPKTGMCGADPCAPKTEREWRSNMRVVFRIVKVEAESDVFEKLD
jgi:ABC-type nitrate/sulfonate/bicarbonate transport system substrate-binding protein/outer membrane protein OmpA-like peptidoglycan-associated protein